VELKVGRQIKKKVTFADLRCIPEDEQLMIIEEENKRGSKPCPRRTSLQKQKLLRENRDK
jgi:hypothetical protein